MQADSCEHETRLSGIRYRRKSLILVPSKTYFSLYVRSSFIIIFYMRRLIAVKNGKEENKGRQITHTCSHAHAVWVDIYIGLCIFFSNDKKDCWLQPTTYTFEVRTPTYIFPHNHTKHICFLWKTMKNIPPITRWGQWLDSFYSYNNEFCLPIQ